MLVETLPAAEARKRFSDVVLMAGHKRRSVRISHHRNVLVAVVPIRLFELCDRLAETADGSDEQNDIFVQIVQLMRQMKE